MSSAVALKAAPSAKSPSVPRPRRRLRVAPNMSITLRPDFVSAIEPKTRLGAIALQLAEQTVITTLSVAAISSYVYAITQSAAPTIQFTDMPPGMPNSQLEPLQDAYDQFLQQFATLQGQAGTWINTQQGTGTPSIFSQLVLIPSTMNVLNSTVSANFTTLNALTPGTPAYNNVLAQQKSLIGSEQPAIGNLVTSMQTLGTNLQNGSDQLIASTQTGVLSQMLAAYQVDIASLNTDITNCQNQINSDNSKIIGLGVGAGVSVTVGLVGLVNFWNPIGWIMMAEGGVGAYFSITEIETLKAQIAQLEGQIQSDIAYRTSDEQAAMMLSAFCNQLQGFASMNTAAQQELLALENLYSTLSDDITLALGDLDADNLQAAQNEWNTILQSSAALGELTAYIWPNSAELSAPTTFTAIGGDIYYIATSGELYHYAGGTGSWNDMGVTALSCVGAGSTLVAIDGAPIDGAVIGAPSGASTYFVKQYDMNAGTWTTISTFPAAAIATGGGAIYAINQLVGDRRVYRYSGSGTTWTALPQLPDMSPTTPDAAYQIAVAGGVLFALSINAQQVFRYDAGNGWTQVMSLQCASITANGNKLGIVATNLNAYLLDPTSGQGAVNFGGGVTTIAQLTNGDEYRTGVNLDLWYADTNANPPTYTGIANNVTGVYVSDTDLVYYTDNLGNLFLIPSTGATPVPVPGITS